MFDTNGDLIITADELRASPLLKASLAPDVDLNHDGQPDGMSFGLGFDAVGAKLAR